MTWPPAIRDPLADHILASKNFRRSNHTIVEGYGRPEDWVWCFLDGMKVDHPASGGRGSGNFSDRAGDAVVRHHARNRV